jgi:hypothetical protein
MVVRMFQMLVVLLTLLNNDHTKANPHCVISR